MSSTERGIFDGENPPSTTFIFDLAIFDVLLTQPVVQNQLTVFVHGNDKIQTLWHGNETIPRSTK